MQELFQEKFIRRALRGEEEDRGDKSLTIVQCLTRCSALTIQKLEKKLKHYKYVHAFYKGIKRSGWLRSEGDRRRPCSVPVPRVPT